MVKKKMRCDVCGMRTPVIYKHGYQVTKSTSFGRSELIEEWTECGPDLCQICHNKLLNLLSKAVRVE